MRLVWTTDPHLNHAEDTAWQTWIESIASHEADGVVITGDISEGDDVIFQLKRLATSIGSPVFFILGNHDFYESSVAKTRMQVMHTAREFENLHYLTDSQIIPLDMDGSVALIGEDGWGDASEGDYEGTTIRLNDFQRIEDFRDSDPATWKSQLLKLGAESADRVRAKLQSIPSSTRQIIVATHVPPFCESCWYEGRTTDENWAPFFVCGQLGKVLLSYADQHDHQMITVLCGHTHHGGIARMKDNLVVHTGGAVYQHPAIEAVIDCGAENISFSKR